MLDVNVLIVCLAGAIIAAVIVFAVTARGRRVLQDEAAAARSAQAVAESRLADLTAAQAILSDAHRKLNDEHLALSRERERLSTTLEKAAADLQREMVTAATLRGQLDEKTRLLSHLESDHRVAKSQYQGLETRLAEQKSWVEEQTRFFEQKITIVAAQLLEEKSRAFTEVNRKELDAVVTPFKEQLGEFRQRVDSIYAADSRDRGQLAEQVAQLARLNQTVSLRAEELTKALTISSKATGDWGEMILRRILEDSGLREGQEYTLQHTVTAGAEDALQRPDAVIFLPEERQVVVDSKVSNKAWKEYCAADEQSRGVRLAEHLASLRSHIRELSARDYPRSPDLKTVDFVLMFVPVEAALLTALAHDETLYTDAYRAKIILVTPSTLMAVLKLVEGMWAFQKRKESADKIAEAGRKLYEKLTVFSNTFVEIGEAIEKAHGTFEKARSQLVFGKGNTIRLAQKMVELGVRPAPGKVMPAELIELAGEEPDEAVDDEDVTDVERPQSP